jgi:hypothetical protein
MSNKKLTFNLILILVFFSVLTCQVLARSSFSLGTEEVKVSKELAEAEVMTYNIELESNIAGISYYIRSNDPLICWLRLYDFQGKKVYSKDFGGLFSRFIGRSENQLIQNLTRGKYTLDIIAPSYQTCGYELYLIGLTKQKLVTIPNTELYKTNQELIKKDNKINTLNELVDELRDELEKNNKKIKNLEKEKSQITNTVQKLMQERGVMQKRINLLTKICYALIIIIICLVLYNLYRYNQKRKKKQKNFF